MPIGSTFIGEIVSTGAIAHAPRTLRLLLSKQAIAVREDDRLLWLETDRLSAFTDSDGQTKVIHHAEQATFVPRDTGAEARALTSLRALRAWIDARSQSTPVPAAMHLGRSTDQIALKTEDGRLTAAIRDLETGVVLSARGQSLRGEFEIRMTSVEITKSRTDQFLPA